MAAALRLHRDGSLRLVSQEGLECPPVEVGRSGLALQFSGLHFVSPPWEPPIGIRLLGYGADFRGLYLEEAELQVLPHCTFEGARGLRMTLADVAVGAEGVTATGAVYWPVRQQDGHIHSDGGPVGYLLDPAWEIAPALVEVELRDNLPRQMRAAGLMRVPMLGTVLRAEFGLAPPFAGEGYHQTLRLTKPAADGPPLTVGPLRLERLDVNGTIETAGFSLQGALQGLRLMFAGRTLSADTANVEMEYRAGMSRARVALAGVVSLPLLGTCSEAALELSSAEDAPRVKLNARWVGGLAAHEGGALSYDELSIGFDVGPEQAVGSGTLRGLRLQLPFLQAPVRLDSAQVSARVGPEGGEFSIALGRIALGPLGEVRDASLVVASSAEGPRVALSATVAWNTVAGRIQLPPRFIAPPENGVAKAELTWSQNVVGEAVLSLRLSAELERPERLYPFIPSHVAPEVRRAMLQLAATYASAASFRDAATDGGLAGEVSLKAELRLKPLPRFVTDLLHLHTGDAEGWITAAARAALDAEGHPALAISVERALRVELVLPGLPQTPAPIELELTEISLSGGLGPDASATLKLAGTFALHPVLPPAFAPIASILEKLLEPLRLSDPSGTCTFELSYSSNGPSLSIRGTLDHHIQVNLLHLIEMLTRNAPSSGMDLRPDELPLALEIGFGLTGIELNLSAPSGTVAVQERFALKLSASLRIGGAVIQGFLRFSDRELTIGLEDTALPLRLPAFPLTLEDVEGLGNPARVAALEAELASLRTQISAEEAALTGRVPDRDARITALAGTRRRLGALEVKLLLLRELRRIRSNLRETYSNGNTSIEPRRTYDTLVAQVVREANLLTGAGGQGVPYLAQDGEVRFNPQLALRLEGVAFRLPLSNPRDIGVQGTARFIGFAADDPLRVLENVGLTLGLSADLIFFGLTGGGTPIPLPSFGRYPGGSVTLGQAKLGFGYTKRSLAVAFSGAVRLPPQLVEDADTSDLAGVGVRLPSRAALDFRFDLIPVPYIKVLPYFEFRMDLRDTVSPGLVDSARAEPFWDGLQLHVPGLIRADVKLAAFSPMFGPFIAPNYSYDYDIQLGDERNGYTYIYDNALVIAAIVTGTSVMLQLPGITGTPFFDNIVLSFRMAGFSLSWTLQRPFPTFSPLALFEALGLLSDPMMPVEHKGELANMMRITLRDATLVLPPEARALFPGAAPFISRPLNLTLNLGDCITALQTGMRVARTVADTLSDTRVELGARIQQLREKGLEPVAEELMSMLPPEVRRFTFRASLAGFEGEATVALIDAKAAAAELGVRLSNPPGPRVPPVGLPGGIIPRPRPPGPIPVPPSSRRVLAVEAFDGFDASHLTAMSRQDLAGVVVGARLRLLDSQEYRFLGFVFDDGSFRFTTQAKPAPLRLGISGLGTLLTLEISGGLVLEGGPTRAGQQGSIQASVTSASKAFGNALELRIGHPQPARLTLFSSGRFTCSGDVAATLFGTATLIGSAQVDEHQCVLQGTLVHEADFLLLQLQVTGRLEAPQGFSLSGIGSLRLFGVALPDVEAELTARGARLRLPVKTSATGNKWWTGRTVLEGCHLHMDLEGTLSMNAESAPSLLLRGPATLEVLGLRIEGEAELRAGKKGGLTTKLRGNLLWQKRRWAAAQVELASDRVTIEGAATVGLDLPAPLAGVPGLVFQLELEGRFTLSTTGALVSYSLRGEWMLGARLSNGPQVTPLASGSLPEQNGGAQLALVLVNVAGFRSVPLDGLTLPIPVFSPASSPAPISFRRKGNLPPYFEWNGFEIPPSDNGDVIGALPLAFSKNENVTIPIPKLDPQFWIRLMWRDGKLGLEIGKPGMATPFPFFSFGG
jgi:hypothetical protein